MKYKCFILDDEPLAIKVIEQYLSKLEQFEVSGTSTDPIKAFEILKDAQFDLLFLDIEMPGINGLELAKTLSHIPEIIVTTAYREYAVEGFELNVLDYLVKPIPFGRFLLSIDRFLNKKDKSEGTELISTDAIYVRADRKEVRICFDDILYVEGLKDYIKIVMPDRQVLTKFSIGHFQSKLPPDRFVRVHKSFVVAIDKITAYTAHDVEIGEIEIPVGRVYKEAFRMRMQK
jgi:two-component system, LytTR family, response regulator